MKLLILSKNWTIRLNKNISMGVIFLFLGLLPFMANSIAQTAASYRFARTTGTYVEIISFFAESPF